MAKRKKQERTIIIDGDTLVFAAASSSETATEWGDGLWTLHADLNEGIAHFEGEMNRIVEGLRPDHIVIALSDYSIERFRNLVLPTYKDSRGRKPVIYNPIREFVEETYDTYVRPSLEGDDIIGILMTHPKAYPGEKVGVYIDKDLKTIPGSHINYAHAIRDKDWTPHIITEDEADHFFYTQVLTGDSTDGYKGCPGVGPVKAAKILDCDPSVWWAVTLAAYEKAGLTRADAIQQARVARILRAEDYDMKKREVLLWDPPVIAAG